MFSFVNLLFMNLELYKSVLQWTNEDCLYWICNL